MADAVYYPSFSKGSTFKANFEEFRALYRGVSKVWIGDNTETNPGKVGYLYAEYKDGEQQELGLVSEYPYAKAVLDPLRPTPLTQEEWYELLASIPGLAEQVSQDTSDAGDYADDAWGWANNHDGTLQDYSSTNNSKYWAEQSKSFANGKNLADQTVNPTNNSEYFKDQSKLWANYGTDGDVPSASNNAKSYAANAASAQAKAELAMSHYPRINNNDNWETWDVENEDWQDTGHKSMAYASIEYAYQNSTSGTVPPTGTWTENPQPQNAKFLWMRMKYTWTNGRIDYFYNVSYIGANGTGSVNSVNGLGGDVILDGTNIYVDDNAQTKETVYAAFTRIGTSITNAEIDALFV